MLVRRKNVKKRKLLVDTATPAREEVPGLLDTTVQKYLTVSPAGGPNVRNTRGTAVLSLERIIYRTWVTPRREGHEDSQPYIPKFCPWPASAENMQALAEELAVYSYPYFFGENIQPEDTGYAVLSSIHLRNDPRTTYSTQIHGPLPPNALSLDANVWSIAAFACDNRSLQVLSEVGSPSDDVAFALDSNPTRTSVPSWEDITPIRHPAVPLGDVLRVQINFTAWSDTSRVVPLRGDLHFVYDEASHLPSGAIGLTGYNTPTLPMQADGITVVRFSPETAVEGRVSMHMYGGGNRVSRTLSIEPRNSQFFEFHVRSSIPYTIETPTRHWVSVEFTDTNGDLLSGQVSSQRN